jgi:hypothetical protein
MERCLGELTTVMRAPSGLGSLVGACGWREGRNGGAYMGVGQSRTTGCLQGWCAYRKSTDSWAKSPTPI